MCWGIAVGSKRACVCGAVREGSCRRRAWRRGGPCVLAAAEGGGDQIANLVQSSPVECNPTHSSSAELSPVWYRRSGRIPAVKPGRLESKEGGEGRVCGRLPGWPSGRCWREGRCEGGPVCLRERGKRVGYVRCALCVVRMQCGGGQVGTSGGKKRVCGGTASGQPPLPMPNATERKARLARSCQ